MSYGEVHFISYIIRWIFPSAVSKRFPQTREEYKEHTNLLQIGLEYSYESSDKVVAQFHQDRSVLDQQEYEEYEQGDEIP